MVKTQENIAALKKKMRELESAQMPQKAVDRYTSAIQKAQQKVDALAAKMKALEAAKTPTQDYLDVSKQIADAEKRQASLNDRMEKFVELGGNTGSKQYKSMQYDAAELENTIAYAKGELQDLVETGKAFTLGSGTEEYQNLQKQLEQAQAQLKAAQTNYANGKATFQEKAKTEHASAAAEIAQEQERLNGLASKYQELQAQVSGTAWTEALAAGFGKVAGAAKSAFSKISTGAQSAAKGIGSLARFSAKTVGALTGIGPLLKGIRGSSGSAGNAASRLGKRILELAKSAFIFNLLSAGFRQVTSGIGSAFQSYLGYDASLKSSINGLRAQLSALQGSLASAFAPIVSAVVPYLSTLISWVTTAANAVAQFIAVLTGRSSYKKAVANVGAVGAAADGAAGSLGDATKAAEELEKALGDYDELKVIEQPKDSAGGGSGGGGGGAGGAGDITYEDVEIASAISDFAEKVKEAWANSDFTEVGGIIGQKLNEALEAIPWDGIQATAQKIGTSLATLINGFVETSGLGGMVGKTVGEAINTGILGAEAFTDKLHFDSVGKFIADGINGALTTIKWDNLTTVAKNLGDGLASALNKIMTVETFSNIGESFANAVNTVVSGAHSFVSGANWNGWGSAIAGSINSFFSTFGWKKAGLTFSDAVDGILKTLCAAVEGIEWDDVGTSIATALKAVDWKSMLKSAADLVGSVFTGLLDFAGGLWQGLTESDWEKYNREIQETASAMQKTNDEVATMIEQADAWKTTTSDEAEYAKTLAERYFDLAENTNKTVEEKQEMKDLAKKLVDTLPDLQKYYDEETGLLDTTRESVYDLITALNEKAKVEAATESLKKYYEAQYKSKVAMEESAQQGRILETQKAALAAQEDELTAKIIAGEAGNQDYIYSLEDMKIQLGNTQGSINTINDTIDENKKVQAEANENYKNASKEIENVNKWVNDYNDSASTASAKTEELTKKFEDLSKESQVSISISMQGGDVSLDRKMEVIAEVTGVDVSKLPYSEKGIDDMYANIVEAYAQQGVSVQAPFYASSMSANGKTVSTGIYASSMSANGKSVIAPMYASGLSNNGKSVTAPMYASGLSNNGKSVTAPVKATKVTSNGKTLTAPIKASRIASNNKVVSARVRVTGQANVPVIKANVSVPRNALRVATGGIYQNGIWSSLPQKAAGGILNHGIWSKIATYAAGGAPGHGSMFVAGEAGPEVVGHVGGRTEVLNKSQLASVMYSAVLAAMSEAVNNLAAAVFQRMAECTNAVIANMGYIVDSIYAAGNMQGAPQLQLAGAPANYTLPDANVVAGVRAAGAAGSSGIDYDKLAGAVARRISNDSSYQFIAQLNGRTIFDETVRQNQLYIKQTGRSGFER